jgi:hypothetical protein
MGHYLADTSRCPDLIRALSHLQQVERQERYLREYTEDLPQDLGVSLPLFPRHPQFILHLFSMLLPTQKNE